MEKIAIEKLRPSPLNPRSKWNDLEELARGLLASGQIVPLIVKIDGDGFSIVDGERRYRAAKLAGLLELSCEVTEVADEIDELSTMLRVNAQRQTLSMIERADAVRAMIERGSTCGGIALSMGIDERKIDWLYRVSRLTDALRVIFDQGRLSERGAELFGSQPAHVQHEIANDIATYDGDHYFTTRECLGLLESHVRAFGDPSRPVPFDPDDAALVPSAGSCAVCPKRTASQLPLFAEIARADRCLDAGCWRAKSSAAWDLAVADAVANEIRVLTDDEAREVLAPGFGVRDSAPWVALSDDPLGDGVPWSTYAAGAAAGPNVAIARHPESDRFYRLLDRTVAAEVIRDRDPELARKLLRLPDPKIAVERHERSATKKTAAEDRARLVKMVRYATREFRRIYGNDCNDARAETLAFARLRRQIEALCRALGEDAAAFAADVAGARRDDDVTGEVLEPSEAIARYACVGERTLEQLNDLRDALIWFADHESTEERISAWDHFADALDIRRNDSRFAPDEKPKRRRKKVAAELEGAAE
jgi:ParB/RepB/Spo0J family partition protein